MHRQTKHTAISQKVKRAVAERDSIDGRCCCILCGSPYAIPNAHVVRRSQGGMGIEKNVVALCDLCHRAFDEGEELERLGQYTTRLSIKQQIIAYLESYYPGWNEEEMKYKKENLPC